MWEILLEFLYLSSAIYFLHYLMAKSIVFQEISEQPPTPLLLPPFHVLTTTQTKPTKKHLRVQLNWQNTNNTGIQISAAKITRSSKCRDQNIGDNLFYCWPPAKLNRPYLRRNSRDKQTFLRLKVPPQENAPSCIRYCTSREIQNQNIQSYFLSILSRNTVLKDTPNFLACPDNKSNWWLIIDST